MLQKYQASNICVADDFLEEAQEGDFCFIENKKKTAIFQTKPTAVNIKKTLRTSVLKDSYI